MKLTVRVGVLPYMPGMHYLEIPAKTVKSLGGGFRRRLICAVGTKLKFSCGLMALGGGRGYVMITKARLKELGLRAGDKVTIALNPDKSEYGMEVSEELAEVLKQDEEATRRFKKLSPGKQRNIIHHVSSVKNQDKRIERALFLLENLKRLPEGKETFRGILGIKGER